MTLSYLYKPGNVTLDSGGSGVISVAPGANEFWLPTLVTVGTKIPYSPSAICSLFVGPPGIYDYTTQIDFTWAGNADSSSIISGTIVEPGEQITAQFFGGNPGDSAYMNVVGLASDVPPAEGVIPGFPGSRFSNVGVPAPYQSANRVCVPVNTGTMANGATQTLLPGVGGRQYHIWEIYAAGLTQPADATCQFFSGGSLIAISPSKIVGTPTNTYAVPSQPLHLWGTQLGVGHSLQIQNVSGGNQYYVGYVAYSY